jgi:hypothetical protein
LDRVTDYESKLQGSREQIEKELERQVRLAVEALPEDMRAWVASKGVQVFAGIHHNLGMPSEEIEGGSSDVPRNANVVVGYTITGGIRLGGKPNQVALWEREFIFGVFPFFEKSPKPRLLRTSSISRNGFKVLFNLTESAKGVVYPPGKTSPRYSVTKAQYGQAKTLPQTSSVVAEISEAFGKSVAAWVGWERKEADRKEAEIKAKEEEERKRKEESVRKEMEVQEALRQKELARAKAPSQKTVVDSALSEKFAILDKLISGGFPQAQAAAKAVKEAYESGGKPTEDQLKVLRNMMYRSRMKDEADHFRVASWGISLEGSMRNRLEKLENPVKTRDPGIQGLIERGGAGAGKHKNKQDYERGRARNPKHKGRTFEEGMSMKTSSSSSSFKAAIQAWISDLGDQITASLLSSGMDVVKTQRERVSALRVIVKPPESEGVNIHIVVRMEDFWFLEFGCYILQGSKVIAHRDLSLDISYKSNGDLADHIAWFAGNLYGEHFLER